MICDEDSRNLYLEKWKKEQYTGCAGRRQNNPFKQRVKRGVYACDAAAVSARMLIHSPFLFHSNSNVLSMYSFDETFSVLLCVCVESVAVHRIIQTHLSRTHICNFMYACMRMPNWWWNALKGLFLIDWLGWFVCICVSERMIRQPCKHTHTIYIFYGLKNEIKNKTNTVCQLNDCSLTCPAKSNGSTYKISIVQDMRFAWICLPLHITSVQRVCV